MMHWYVVYTQTGAELVAQAQLRNQGFNSYFPRYSKLIRHSRREKKIIKPLFPRYIFVQIDLSHQRWRSINGTRGVSYLITMGEKPTPLPHGIVEEIISRESSDHLIEIKQIPAYKKGEMLEITSGALSDQVGKFLRMDNRERIIMLLDLLGRNIEIHMQPNNVRTFA